jgi:hypothetical protein
MIATAMTSISVAASETVALAGWMNQSRIRNAINATATIARMG